MAIPQHLDVLKQGVRVWNEWREENPGAEPDLAGAKLYLMYSCRFIRFGIFPNCRHTLFGSS